MTKKEHKVTTRGAEKGKKPVLGPCLDHGKGVGERENNKKKKCEAVT